MQTIRQYINNKVNQKSMKPPETLNTSRLLLRLPSADDAKLIFKKYAQDSEVTKFLTWHPHEKSKATKAFIERCIKCWEDGTAYPWVITRKEDNELLGMIEMRINGFSADIGYVIAREYWGNGFAPEAARIIVEWALKQDGIHRVWAVCDVDNTASARVMEKVGMHNEGILRQFILHPNIDSNLRDCYCYSITK
jgi:[ribosomal protein S5]-alanine N-acetyltransferase